MPTDHIWRKSRRSANNQTCMEVRDTLDQVRDSKNPTGPVLHANVSALLRAIQAGRVEQNRGY